MANKQAMVKAFHAAMDMPVAIKPGIPNIDRINLRADLIYEEIKELFDEMKSGGDIVKFTKELCDALYVLYGTAEEYGIDAELLNKCFFDVHCSNMSKLVDGKPVKREDGKVMKGPNYQPPNLKQYFK